MSLIKSAAENVEQFDRVESPTPAAKQVSVESPTPAAKQVSLKVFLFRRSFYCGVLLQRRTCTCTGTCKIFSKLVKHFLFASHVHVKCQSGDVWVMWVALMVCLQEASQDKAADVAAQNLLNEAVTDILDVRRRKLSAEQDAAAAGVTTGDSDVTPTPSRDDVNAVTKQQDELLDFDDDGFQVVDIPLPSDHDVTVRPLDELPPRPESPDIPNVVEKVRFCVFVSCLSEYINSRTCTCRSGKQNVLPPRYHTWQYRTNSFTH